MPKTIEEMELQMEKLEQKLESADQEKKYNELLREIRHLQGEIEKMHQKEAAREAEQKTNAVKAPADDDHSWDLFHLEEKESEKVEEN